MSEAADLKQTLLGSIEPEPPQVQPQRAGPWAALDSVKCILTHGGPSWNHRRRHGAWCRGLPDYQPSNQSD